MTYDFNVSNDFQSFFVEESAFKNIYSKTEKNIVVNLCKRVFNPNFTNGSCVRLEQCNNDLKTELTLSLIGFFDFLTTDFLILNYTELYRNADESEKILLEKYKKHVMEKYLFDSFAAIIGNRFLSNILAVSCIIYDDKGLLLTKRNGSVGISNSFISTSVTGSVDKEDCKRQNPIYSCCRREIAEELNVHGIDYNMNLTKIVCGQCKLQPIALVNIKVADLDILTHSIQKHKGFFEENSGFYICKKQNLLDLLKNDSIQLTEAARTHLEDFADGKAI